MKGIARGSVVVLMMVGLAACRTAPIYNVGEEGFGTASAPLDQRAALIKRAGAKLGWIMTDLEPGKMRGKLSLREHVADVLINYTPQTFAIRYEDSVNLAYDGSLIHKNYNSWVRRLEKEIYRQSLASPSS